LTNFPLAPYAELHVSQCVLQHSLSFVRYTFLHPLAEIFSIPSCLWPPLSFCRHRHCHSSPSPWPGYFQVSSTALLC
jgi:hypothetical protein